MSLSLIGAGACGFELACLRQQPLMMRIHFTPAGMNAFFMDILLTFNDIFTNRLL
jgi:hypothetical protein